MINNQDFLGMGLKFPVSVNSMTGRFEMSSAEEDIKESIYIILMTQKGERLLLPRFGSQINDYVFETMDETNLTLMASSVKSAIEAYEKRIKDVNISFSMDEMKEGKLVINITYVISETNQQGNMVFPFYLQEGEGKIDE